MADSDGKLLEQVKGLLYLDGAADNDLLRGYIAAADQFIKNAVGDNEAFYAKDNVKPLFESAVKALAGTYYQYRLALSDTQTFPVNLTVNSIIGQLRGRYELEVGDDDEISDQSAQPSN